MFQRIHLDPNKNAYPGSRQQNHYIKQLKNLASAYHVSVAYRSVSIGLRTKKVIYKILVCCKSVNTYLDYTERSRGVASNG